MPKVVKKKLKKTRQAKLTPPEVEEDVAVSSEAENVENNASFMEVAEEEDDDGGDSDKELQIALKEGLIKSDALNYVVAKKRPTIVKTDEIKAKLAKFSTKDAWIHHLDVTVDAGLSEEILEDDFKREIAIYKQAEKSLAIVLPRLEKLQEKIFRPSNYYAQMVKTDEHMQKVRKRLLEVKEDKERQEAIRRVRQEKKFASKVQKEVIENKQSEKKTFLETVKKHRKGMRQQLDDMLSNARKMQIDEDDDDRQVIARGGSKGEMQHAKRKMSRDVRNQRFGFGGQKKRMKHNDKNSFDDVFTTGPLAGKSNHKRGAGKFSRGGKKRFGGKRR